MVKANPNYEGSAVMLTNPPQIAELLTKYRKEEADMIILQEQMKKCIPQELLDRVDILGKWHVETNNAIRSAIDELGSYQDIEKGWYAIKQKRESITYKPELVRQYAPSKVASFVIVESVDSKALDALLKAGQISAEDARRCGEIKESFAYIIR